MDSPDARVGPPHGAKVVRLIRRPRNRQFIGLLDPEGVRRYLIGNFIDPDLAGDVASRVETPLLVTKRGAILISRND
jgi:hypothetical protein